MSSTARWKTQVIEPLRAVRRSLKQGYAGVPQETSIELGKKIGNIEIESEFVEQLLLALHGDTLPQAKRTDAGRAAKTSIERYFACLGARPGKATREDLAVLIAASVAP